MSYMNTASLEDWKPGAPVEVYRRVEIVERYEFDRRPRLKIKILEGPEAGRIVGAISPESVVEVVPAVCASPTPIFKSWTWKGTEFLGVLRSSGRGVHVIDVTCKNWGVWPSVAEFRRRQRADTVRAVLGFADVQVRVVETR